MQTITIVEAQARLVDLVDAAASGEEVFIRKDDGTTVQLVARQSGPKKRQFGSARGRIAIQPGFSEPLADFDEYR